MKLINIVVDAENAQPFFMPLPPVSAAAAAPLILVVARL
jgi:hypothetical protein